MRMNDHTRDPVEWGAPDFSSSLRDRQEASQPRQVPSIGCNVKDLIQIALP